MSNLVVDSSDAAFEADVLKADKLVLVDFWAPWCGPCKSIAPIMSEIAADFQGKLKVVKFNVDQNAVTPSTYGVKAIPLLIFFKDGKVVSQMVGAVSREKIVDEINKLL
jgi:thioredoxin 1